MQLVVILLKSGLILIALFVVALLMEKLFNKEKNLEELVHQLKSDIATVIKALFSNKPPRHCFDFQLAEELKKVARPYSNKAFDIDVIFSFDPKALFINISFVQNKIMTVDELNEVSNLLLLKFRRYLTINNLIWNTFACYNSGENYVNVYLYYAEFPEDMVNLMNIYKKAVREKSDINYGVIKDDDLNKELENVN